jgi:hypothetical protein
LCADFLAKLLEKSAALGFSIVLPTENNNEAMVRAMRAGAS